MKDVLGAAVTGLIAIVCFLVATSADVGATIHRHARQAAFKPEYYVDVLVLTDYAVYKSWYDRTSASQSSIARHAEAVVDMKRYFTVVMQQVSQQYSRLETSFVVTFSPVGFYIIQSEDAVTWTERDSRGLVDASQALDRLGAWLKDQRSLPAYDHALLFTGENLDGSDNGVTAGRGTVGTACSQPGYSSMSVVEDRGAFQSVRVAAHELGHSLNAVHDGQANACPAAERYVMAAGSSDVTPENSRHPWFFSSCSTTEIADYVQGVLTSANVQNISCLTTRLPSSSVPDVTGVIPGQLYNTDEQCRHLYGPLSSFYFLGNLSDVCLLLSCGDPTDSQGSKYWERVAAEGTTCGNKQWCQVGQCVASPAAPAVDTCYRDSVWRVNNLACPELVATQPAQCYQQNVANTLCCQSCHNRNSNISGCPYGDRKKGCTNTTCRQIFSNGLFLDYDCCGTCNFDSTTWVCADTTLVDGLTCQEALRRDGLQGCYNSTLAYLCCATCEQQRDLSKGKGCEYGDRLLNRCPYPAGGDVTQDCDATLCCDTCRSTSGSKRTKPHMTIVTMMVLYTGLCWASQHWFGHPGL